MLTNTFDHILCIYARWRNSPVVKASAGTTTAKLWLLFNSEPESLATKGLVPLCSRIVGTPCVWGELFAFYVLDVAKEEKANKGTFILKEFGRLYRATAVTNEHSMYMTPTVCFWKSHVTSPFSLCIQGCQAFWRKYFVQLLIWFSAGVPEFWSWAVASGEWLNPL